MTDSKVEDVEKLIPILTLIANLKDLEVRIIHEGQATILEIRPSSEGPKIICHDDILAIVELVKKHENFLMYILADSSEPIIRIHRRGLIH